MEQALGRALERIEELEARLARVESRPAPPTLPSDGAAADGSDVSDGDGSRGVSRRRVLGVIGVGAAGAALAVAPRPAAAAAGDAVLQGQVNDAGNATTTLVAESSNGALVIHGGEEQALSVSSSGATAIAGSGNVGTGVRGYSSGAPGVEGHSDGNWGVRADGGLGGAHGECFFTRTVGELANDTAGAYGKGPVGVRAVGQKDPDAPVPASGPTVGVLASGDTAVDATGATALRTTGRLEFSRSGIAWVPAGASYVDVDVADTATAPLRTLTTRVLATSMGPSGSVEYAQVRTARRIRINLNSASDRGTRVAWLVIG